MEIDERLQVGGHELIDHKDHQHHDDTHQPERHQGEVDTVPAFPALRQPVDYHTQHKQEIDVPIVVKDIGDNGQVPLPADAGDHILGREGSSRSGRRVA